MGGSLSNLENQAVNLKDRVFDVGQISYVYNPGLYPLGTVTTLPVIEDDSDKWARVTHEFTRDTPELQAEFTAMNQKYMFTWCLDPMEMMSHVPIHTLDDFQGLKIRVHGGAALAAEKLGWAGVSVPWEEIAVAAQNRLVDASCHPVAVVGRDAGLHTIFKYYIQPFIVYQFHFATVMNLEAWNEIPADLQAIIMEVNDESVEDALDYLHQEMSKGRQDLVDAGVEFIDFPATEYAKFVELAGAPVWADWVTEMNALGLPAQKILNEYQAALDAYVAP